ncbi:MAG TPA: SIR2 family protein [Solirubrobacterales bacterium]|nr:SIR2 family protein [Solirubrobacterales bacterium]
MPEPSVARFEEAATLPKTTWRDIRKLARQLEGTSFLPVIGAGGSIDCGQRLAAAIAVEMYEQFGREGLEPRPTDLPRNKKDLGVVADAFYNAADQEAAVEALGLKDPSKWPDKDKFEPHFCSYRLLARMAREEFFSEAITLNYDCGFERGLHDEGFGFAPWELHGKRWLDHATVVTGARHHFSLSPRGCFVLTKAHGCASTYRKEVAHSGGGSGLPEARPEDAIVLRRGQLLDWRTDFWARDLFADRARRHVILLIGFSGQDPVIQLSLTRVLQEVYERLRIPEGEACEMPRVVAIDRKPKTVALTTLIHQGCGRRPPGAGTVTAVKVPDNKSVTAVVGALASELLALRLKREQGLTLPSQPADRIASMLISTPASLRWTYLLERRTAGVDYAQRVNLEKAQGRGYVPLRAGATRAAASVLVRRQLRLTLGLDEQESIRDADAHFGFVCAPRRGFAYMPIGVTAEELASMRPAELASRTEVLPRPAELEPVLVMRGPEGLEGRVIATGKIFSIK